MLETLACSAVLLTVYAFAIERRASFRWCRFYLLAATAASALIPLLDIPVWPGKVVRVNGTVSAPEVIGWEGWSAEIVAEAPAAVTVESILTLVYIAGIAVLAAMMLWQVARIARLRRGSTMVKTDRYTLVRTQYEVAAFSFFRSIYLWARTPEPQFDAIVAHEASHIAHRHSAERLAMESMKALMWWNPLAWALSRRLGEVEEFEADNDVLNSGIDRSEYMETILKQLFGYSPDIANGLHNSLTKKRFKMMTTPIKSSHSLLRMAVALPFVIGLLCAFGFKSRAAVVVYTEPAATETTITTTTPTSIEEVEIQQPKTTTAVAKSITLVISDDHGPLQGAAIVIEGSDQGVVTGADGKAQITIPYNSTVVITYPGYERRKLVLNEQRLNAVDRIAVNMGSPDKTAVAAPDEKSGNATSSPLFIVDGVETGNINELDPHSIASISVLKDSAATEAYGARGKHGVILIATKHNSAVTPGNIPAEEPVISAEVMPQFISGDPEKQDGNQALAAWISANLKYPAEALEKNISGKVMLTFVVDKDGSVRDIKALRSPSPILTDEAVRLLGTSPKWKPGMQDGKAVAVSYYLPVEFRLPDNAKAAKADDEAVFRPVEVMPQFPTGDPAKPYGDISAFRRWVTMQIRYPAEAVQKGITGRVLASFAIEKDGSMGEIKVLESPNKLLSEEVVRMLKSSPAWKPGTQHENPIRVTNVIPVDFMLQGGKQSADKTPKPEVPKGAMEEIIVISYPPAK